VHAFDDEAGLANQPTKFTGRSEASFAPERGAEPPTKASPYRPGTPFAEFADNEAAPGPQHTGNFLKDGSRVFDEAKNGYCCRDVELFSGEGELLRRRYPKDNIRTLLFSPRPCRFDHGRRSVNARHDCVALYKFERELTIAATHIQDRAVAQITGEFQDQPLFKSFGDGADLGGTPLGVGIRR
jgi:hypothetical protein